MFFRHRADRPYVFLFVLLFAVDLTVYALVDNPWLVVGYLVASIFPKAAVCAFNHHHQHVTTFHQAWANRLLEVMYFYQSGVSTNAWRLHHSLGHHLNYLDQTKDESRWARADGSRMGEMEYAFITAATAYTRAWKVGEKFPEDRRVFAAMGLVTAIVTSLFVAYRPVPGLILFVLGPLFFLWGTAWATYAHHSDRSTENHLVASNNIRQTFYNVLTGNLGLHTAHHSKPGVHWSKLPELHASIESQIPPEAFVAPGWPWRWFGDPKLATTAKPASELQVPAGQVATELG
jgi:fatty acid desaturase